MPMSYALSLPKGDDMAIPAVVLEAARCWRAARDAGKAIQPSLFAMLAKRGGGVLAPVFDSLMTLCEAALGRRLRVGSDAVLTSDEHLLLDLLAAPDRAGDYSRGGAGIASALGCALRSTRIMMRLALGSPIAGAETPA
jgi:hypothetical protein